jgi:Mg-chelatase subunit ChlD
MDFSSPADMPVAGQPSAMPPLGSAAQSQTPRILIDGEEQTQSGFDADSDMDGLAEAMPEVTLPITDGEDFEGPRFGGRELQLNQGLSEVALNEAAVEEKGMVVKQQEMAATPPGRRSKLSNGLGETEGFANGESKQSVAIESAKKLSDMSMLGENAATEMIAGLPMSAYTGIKRKEARSLDELSAVSDPFSTFSLHVSDVSFKLAAAALAVGQFPDPSTIRIEEFVNAFDYFDPLPANDERVACQIEQAIHPFMLQRNVLRISLRTAATGRSVNVPLRLTLLLDNSGSMERVDRKQNVRRAFESLAGQVKPNDQVTLISFANQPRLLAERFSGSQVADLVQLVENLPSEGGTNLEAALKLAMEKASEGITPGNAAGLQNRVVLMTDGAVNLGDANPASLSQLVSQMRDAGIAFDAAGISAHELNDGVLEALTRQGDGRYYLLDSAEDASAGFADQIAGALRPAAKNVKVQVEFNPDRVGQYKLLGFEKHLLKQENFRNDKVDAAEMAAAEAGVAVYQFEAKPDGRGDIGTVSVRFQDLATGTMIERRWPIPYEPRAVRIHQGSPPLRLATTAAMFAAKLRGDALGESVELASLADLLATLPTNLEAAPRVRQLQTMINAARQIGEPQQ